MHVTKTPEDDDRFSSLVLILPLALAGFMLAAGCWALFSVAGTYIRQSLGLNDLAFGFLLSLPMATGAMLAIPVGLAAQKFGPRRMMLICLGGLMVCMCVLAVADSLMEFLLAGAGLGLAGGYYSAGLQFVTRYTPANHTGLVLGLFGAGITGVGISYTLVPLILRGFTWPMVPVAYLILLSLVLILLLFLTERESPVTRTEVGISLSQMRLRRGWIRLLQQVVWFGMVAGSFFALALWLPDFLAGRYQLPVQAGAAMAQWFILPGAAAQILGGWLSDRSGSLPVASRVLVVCLVSLFVLSYPSMTLVIQGVGGPLQLAIHLPLPLALALLLACGLALGCAVSALQRMIIQENQGTAGLVAGMLLVSACSIGFLLPVLFAFVNQYVGVRSAAFMIPFLLLAATLLLLVRDARRQERKALLHREL